MADTQTCPSGHRGGLITRDGVLIANGRERYRYRCESSDGSFHRFIGTAEEFQSRVPHPVADRPSLPVRRSRGAVRSAFDGDDETVLMQPLFVVPDDTVQDLAPVRLRDGSGQTTGMPEQASEQPVARSRRPSSSERVVVLPSPPTEEEKFWYLGAQNRW